MMENQWVGFQKLTRWQDLPERRAFSGPSRALTRFGASWARAGLTAGSASGGDIYERMNWGRLGQFPVGTSLATVPS